MSPLCALFSAEQPPIYPSVAKRGQGLKREYCREALWGVPSLLSENVKLAKDVVSWGVEYRRVDVSPTLGTTPARPCES